MKPTKTIFVTGGTGFIGGHFLQLASKRSWRLRCLVRKSPKRSHPNIEWIIGDLTGSGWIHALKDCDTVVHLAASPLPLCEKNPLTGCRVIVGGFSNLFKKAIQYDVQRFVYASSAEVYGSPLRLPIREKTTPLRPLSAYGFFKACVDLYALAAAGEFELSVCALRFFNVYGCAVDGDIPSTVLRLFAEQILQDRPIVLHASHRNSRDFIHVTDVARAVVLAVEKEKAVGAINIASGQEILLQDAAGRIAKLAGKKLMVDFRPREGRLRRMVADCERARRLLGFRPKVSLEHGLSEVLGEVAAELRVKSKRHN